MFFFVYDLYTWWILRHFKFSGGCVPGRARFRADRPVLQNFLSVQLCGPVFDSKNQKISFKKVTKSERWRLNFWIVKQSFYGPTLFMVEKVNKYFFALSFSIFGHSRLEEIDWYKNFFDKTHMVRGENVMRFTIRSHRPITKATLQLISC